MDDPDDDDYDFADEDGSYSTINDEDEQNFEDDSENNEEDGSYSTINDEDEQNFEDDSENNEEDGSYSTINDEDEQNFEDDSENNEEATNNTVNFDNSHSETITKCFKCEIEMESIQNVSTSTSSISLTLSDKYKFVEDDFISFTNDSEICDPEITEFTSIQLESDYELPRKRILRFLKRNLSLQVIV